MATFNPLGVITDPDVLSATVKLTSETRAASSEVFIDTTTTPKTIQLFVDTGNNSLTSDGVTIKALYSFLKDQWKANSNLIKFPFPMTPITDEQFEFYNGWNLDKVTTSGPASQTTPQLLRTGGWAVKNTAGVDTERWASIITLGTLGATDQVYFQQVDTLTTNNTNNFVLTGTVNQAIQFYSDTNGDGTPDYNYSQFTKLFVREWQKTYAAAALTDIGVTTLSYQAYRFPLTNTADSKIVSLGVSESAALGSNIAISTATWATQVANVTTSSAHGFVTGDRIDVVGVNPAGFNVNGATITVTTPTNFTYSVASNPGAYVSGGAASGDIFNNISMTWANTANVQTGFFSPTTAYFRVVIDADVSGTQNPNPTAEQIYAYIQAQLRLTTNINAGNVSAGTGNKIGKVVPSKLQFIGDDLYTLGQTSGFEGVFISDFNDADINRLHFWGYGSASNVTANISGISWSSNTVTAVTSVAHRFATGDFITIDGVTDADYEGTYQITNVNVTAFTYTLTSNPGAASSGGTATAAEYTNIQYPFTAILTLNFGENLQNDPDAIYSVFFTNDDAGDNTGRDFGTKDAIVVNKKDLSPMSGNAATVSVQLSYDYDGNTQRGTASAGTNAPVTAVAIGLATGQYVKAEGTIARSITNSISLVAPLERNYQP